MTDQAECRTQRCAHQRASIAYDGRTS